LRNRVRRGLFGEQEISRWAAQVARAIDGEFRTGPQPRYVERVPLTAKHVAALKRALAGFVKSVVAALDDIVNAQGAVFPIGEPFVSVPTKMAPAKPVLMRLAGRGLEPWTEDPGDGDFLATCYAPFHRALAELDRARLRLCPICDDMFYATKTDTAACTPAHSNALRQRRSRERQRRNRRR
ncbi:MAG: hypothetical protein WA721_01010, partial [Candidatus Binataceae bacterium]